jgi:hypothetical protein
MTSMPGILPSRISMSTEPRADPTSGGKLAPAGARDVETQQLGCICADNLSPHKARVLLMLALTRTTNTEELARRRGDASRLSPDIVRRRFAMIETEAMQWIFRRQPSRRSD